MTPIDIMCFILIGILAYQDLKYKEMENIFIFILWIILAYSYQGLAYLLVVGVSILAIFDISMSKLKQPPLMGRGDIFVAPPVYVWLVAMYGSGIAAIILLVSFSLLIIKQIYDYHKYGIKQAMKGEPMVAYVGGFSLLYIIALILLGGA